MLCMVLMAAKAGEKDDFSFGIRLGGQSSDVKGWPKATLGFENKRLLGPTMGFIFEIPVLEYFEIRPEVNFASQGTRVTKGDYVFSTWLGYVQVPVLLRGQYGNDKVRGFVHFGPQFGAGAFVFDREKNGDEIIKKTSDSFKDRNWKAFDAGLAFGAGVEFPSAKGLELELRYYSGLSNFQEREQFQELKNNSLQFTLGVKF